MPETTYSIKRNKFIKSYTNFTLILIINNYNSEATTKMNKIKNIFTEK